MKTREKDEKAGKKQPLPGRQFSWKKLNGRKNASNDIWDVLSIFWVLLILAKRKRQRPIAGVIKPTAATLQEDQEGTGTTSPIRIKYVKM